MKKIISLLCCVMLLCAPLTVLAAQDNATWQKVGNKTEWTYQDAEGTNLTARLENYILYIDGVGEIPSYTASQLGNRPWNGKTVVELVIGDGVTSIGANAFAGLEYVYRVTIPVSVLIEDTSAFSGFQKDAYFMIKGMDITDHSVGKMKYSSAESFAKLMMDCKSYRYQVENMYMVQLMQNYSADKLTNIAPADAITTASNPDYPLINYKSTVVIPKGEAPVGTLAYVQHKQQGEAAREVFSIMLGLMEDYQYIYTYNMSVYNILSYEIPSEVTYTMTIPAAYRFPGRTHALIQIGNGVVNILQDEDNSNDTITFTTDNPTTVYALVYKDNF